MSAPFSAHAQQKVPRIGILMTSGLELLGPFREAFRELGYIEGQTIQFEFREARGRAELLPGMAEELVRSKVDVIVSSQTPAAIAAKNATRDIPIVMGAAGDPIATGLVASLARPEGNVTGLSATSAELAAKNLELVREILPGARRVGVLGNATDPFAKPFLEQIHSGARMMRFDIHETLLRTNGEIDGALAAIAKQGADAVILQGSLPPKMALDSAMKYRLPAFTNQRTFAELGALASYSSSFTERARGIAGYVDKILKGAKPADLPVQQPSIFELVINLKTAKALGLTIPPTMLARADEVIE
jgi:putative ABC transport system substrate-binding protein